MCSLTCTCFLAGIAHSKQVSARVIYCVVINCMSTTSLCYIIPYKRIQMYTAYISSHITCVFYDIVFSICVNTGEIETCSCTVINYGVYNNVISAADVDTNLTSLRCARLGVVIREVNVSTMCIRSKCKMRDIFHIHTIEHTHLASVHSYATRYGFKAFKCYILFARKVSNKLSRLRLCLDGLRVFPLRQHHIHSVLIILL